MSELLNRAMPHLIPPAGSSGIANNEWQARGLSYVTGLPLSKRMAPLIAGTPAVRVRSKTVDEPSLSDGHGYSRVVTTSVEQEACR